MNPEPQKVSVADLYRQNEKSIKHQQTMIRLLSSIHTWIQLGGIAAIAAAILGGLAFFAIIAR